MRHVLALALGLLFALTGCTTNKLPENVPDPYGNGGQPAGPTGPTAQPAPQPTTSTQPQPTVSRFPAGAVLIEVRGMTCPIRCVREVKEQIAKAPGVRSVAVDYDARTAIVKVEEGTDPGSIVRYVRPPYSAHVIEQTR